MKSLTELLVTPDLRIAPGGAYDPTVLLRPVLGWAGKPLEQLAIAFHTPLGVEVLHAQPESRPAPSIPEDAYWLGCRSGRTVRSWRLMYGLMRSLRKLASEPGCEGEMDEARLLDIAAANRQDLTERQTRCTEICRTPESPDRAFCVLVKEPNADRRRGLFLSPDWPWLRAGFLDLGSRKTTLRWASNIHTEYRGFEFQYPTIGSFMHKCTLSTRKPEGAVGLVHELVRWLAGRENAAGTPEIIATCSLEPGACGFYSPAAIGLWRNGNLQAWTFGYDPVVGVLRHRLKMGHLAPRLLELEESQKKDPLAPGWLHMQPTFTRERLLEMMRYYQLSHNLT